MCQRYKEDLFISYTVKSNAFLRRIMSKSKYIRVLIFFVHTVTFHNNITLSNIRKPNSSLSFRLPNRLLIHHKHWHFPEILENEITSTVVLSMEVILYMKMRSTRRYGRVLV